MGLSGSGINEENHIVNGSWIAWLIDDCIGAILSVPFCPLPFYPKTNGSCNHHPSWPKLRSARASGIRLLCVKDLLEIPTQ